ncbi:hypothetical protein STCU_09933 [Strigomonas culicis]|uniref:Uncharacterized protein n=1 Tax=Strigomonas culicis TaxID=28005 RepID=S9TPU0_9TRYP|nr:hypothetical protein STCU_09933 [Strigomonas culicis]|eukprot:EPY18488.1 hypothetical protein STCU_09933 [Strigomonas culicis]
MRAIPATSSHGVTHSPTRGNSSNDSHKCASARPAKRPCPSSAPPVMCGPPPLVDLARVAVPRRWYRAGPAPDGLACRTASSDRSRTTANSSNTRSTVPGEREQDSSALEESDEEATDDEAGALLVRTGTAARNPLTAPPTSPSGWTPHYP